MAHLSSLGKYKDFGLLLLRVGLGVMYIMHGYPKLLGGPERWEAIGGAMKEMNITFYPVFWGFMAGLVETVGGVLLIFGLFFRPATIFIAFMMLVATLRHLGAGDGIMGASHAIELCIVLVGLLFIGPGKYSVDKR